MPQKIGMLLTYTNRAVLPAPKSVQVQPPTAPKSAPMTMVRNTYSMSTIIRTPGNSCSSCGR